MVGKSLSHYKILSELGRGGMGIVYKATDTKLDRTVAIKVLPSAALASDDDRARFYREAKAAAQLHHPHIASVFEIDEAVPSDAPHGTQPSPFIAMEFIDGETLQERIKQGPLKLEEAVRIASEIASALEAAHEKGIVHRDIKAANVMLTADGTAKVLDFGLAQTAASTKLTRMGSTLGTVAYMSPEQARGEEVDGRTDIYSLGTVLYEMIAGHLPFAGDYEQAVLYSILNEDPEPLTAVRTGVPMELERLVVKCLAKDPAYRYPKADGLIVDLRRIDTTTVTGSAGMTTRVGVTAAVAVPTPASRPAWVLPAVILAALAAGLLLRPVLFAEEPANKPILRIRLVLPDALSPLRAAITPDDRTLYYVAVDPDNGTRHLATYDFETGEIRGIAGTEGARRPVISRDGRWVAYQNSRSGQWWKLPTSGGEPAAIPGAEGNTSPGGDLGAFEPGGDLLFSATGYGSINRTGSNGSLSTAAVVDTARMTNVISVPAVSPAGTFITWSDWARWVPSTSWILRTGESEPDELLRGAAIYEFTASGHALFLRDASGRAPLALAVPIDLQTGAITGSEVALGRRTLGALSPSGLLVYEELVEVSAVGVSALYRVTASGSAEFIRDLPGVSSQEFAVSGDGSRIVINARPEPGAGNDMYLVEIESGTRTRLTQGGVYDIPAWGAGDEYVYFDHRTEDGLYRTMRRSADGSGTNEYVLADGGGSGDPDLTPDGRLMVFSRGGDIWGFDTEKDSTFMIVSDDARLYRQEVSPDGRYVVYKKGDGNACNSIQVAAVDGSGEPIEIAAAGCYPVWTTEGGHIYFDNQGTISRVAVTTDPVFRQFGPVQTVFTGPDRAPGTSGSLFFDVAADGTLCVSYAPDRAAIQGGTIWVVTNWFEELNRLAPRSD